MDSKKGQKLTLCLESVKRDFMGVFKVVALINKIPYTFYINSEYAVRKTEELIKKHRPGRALKLLKDFNIK